MSEPNTDQRPKRLLSPESVNLPIPTKLDKRQRHNSLLVVDDLPDKQSAMNENETPASDLKQWMTRISAQLELAASKTDIVGLATKQDLDKINDQMLAQGQEIKQIREEMDLYKKDFEALRLTVDKAEAMKLNSSYETTDRMRSGLNVNNMADTPEFLNDYFANVAQRTCGQFVPNLNEFENLYPEIENIFDYAPPLLEEMYGFMESMDVNSSSCINGINMKICKETMDAIPSKFRHLFACSLFRGKFLTTWTCSYVTLIPKIGDKSEAGNWRPISQTNIFAKLLEKIVHKQVLLYLMNNNILSKFQFGFLPDKSTHESIFNVIRHMYSCINNNKIMGVLFLDVAKAFNCINHQVLYKKMRMAGFCERVISWFTTYLDRTQIVRYGDTISDTMRVPAGIAQGTVLGPLLFIFYINDCVKTLDKVKISMFADDCILYYCGNNWNNIHQIMQGELNMFIEWTVKNSLRLNESKTQSMIVGNRSKLSKIPTLVPFLIHGKSVKFVKQYNYLGIVLDAELSLIPMYKNIHKRVIDKVFMLKKLRKYLTYKSSVQIYKQTILPIFDYAGFLLLACNKDRKNEFQIIQNDVLRFCENKKLDDRIQIEVLHKKANLVSLEQRRCKQLLSIMYKLSKDPINIVVPARNTRLHQKLNFRLDNKIGTKYANSPYYKGTKLWNTLSKEIQDSESIYLYKKEIGKVYSKFVKNFYV